MSSIGCNTKTSLSLEVKPEMKFSFIIYVSNTSAKCPLSEPFSVEVFRFQNLDYEELKGPEFWTFLDG